MKKILGTALLAPLTITACTGGIANNQNKVIARDTISAKEKFSIMAGNAINDAFSASNKTKVTRNVSDATVKTDWADTIASKWVADINNDISKVTNISRNNKSFTVTKGAAANGATVTELADLIAALTTSTSKLYGHTDSNGNNILTPGFTCATTSLAAPTITNATFNFTQEVVSGYEINFKGANCNSTDGLTEKETEAKYFVSKKDAAKKFVIAEIENEYESKIPKADIPALIPDAFKTQFNATVLEGEKEGSTAGIRSWSGTAAEEAFTNTFTTGADLFAQEADYSVIVQSEELEIEGEAGDDEVNFEIENIKIKDENNVLASIKEVEFENEKNDAESYEYWNETIISGYTLMFNIKQDETVKTSYGQLDLINANATPKRHAKLDLKIQFPKDKEVASVTINKYYENDAVKNDFPILKYDLLTDDADDIPWLLLAKIK